MVLAELPFVPRWERHRRYASYLGLLRSVAAAEGVGLFLRYDVTNSLVKACKLSTGDAICSDQISRPDWNGCQADALVAGIAAASDR